MRIITGVSKKRSHGTNHKGRPLNWYVYGYDNNGFFSFKTSWLAANLWYRWQKKRVKKI